MGEKVVVGEPRGRERCKKVQNIYICATNFLQKNSRWYQFIKTLFHFDRWEGK